MNFKFSIFKLKLHVINYPFAGKLFRDRAYFKSAKYVQLIQVSINYNKPNGPSVQQTQAKLNNNKNLLDEIVYNSYEMRIEKKSKDSTKNNE